MEAAKERENNRRKCTLLHPSMVYICLDESVCHSKTNIWYTQCVYGCCNHFSSLQADENPTGMEMYLKWLIWCPCAGLSSHYQ